MTKQTTSTTSTTYTTSTTTTTQSTYTTAAPVEATPPLPTAPSGATSARFWPGWICIVWALLWVGIVAVLNRLAQPDEYDTIKDILIVVGASYAAGWIMWQLKGRRRHAGRVIFALTAFAAFWWFMPAHVARIEDKDRVDAVAKNHAGTLFVLAAGKSGLADGDVHGELARLDAPFDRLEARVRDGRYAIVMRRAAAHAAEYELAYLAATGELVGAGVDDIATIARDGELTWRRAAGERYLKAAKDYRAAVEANAENVAGIAAEQKLNSDMAQSMLAQLMRRIDAEEPPREHRLALREAYANALLALFGHLERNAGGWRVAPASKTTPATIVYAKPENQTLGDRHLADVVASRKAVLE